MGSCFPLPVIFASLISVINFNENKTFLTGLLIKVGLELISNHTFLGNSREIHINFPNLTITHSTKTGRNWLWMTSIKTQRKKNRLPFFDEMCFIYYHTFYSFLITGGLQQCKTTPVVYANLWMDEKYSATWLLQCIHLKTCTVFFTSGILYLHSPSLYHVGGHSFLVQF